jgi:hypothetical protein
MLCEGHLGIETHFTLWWLFQIVLSKPSGGLPEWGSSNPSPPRSSGCYLEFDRGHNYDTELGWQKSWFYLPNMVSVLSLFTSERLGGALPPTWWSFPTAPKLRDLVTQLAVIDHLRAQGLTGLTVMHYFFRCWVLPLKEMDHPQR